MSQRGRFSERIREDRAGESTTRVNVGALAFFREFADRTDSLDGGRLVAVVRFVGLGLIVHVTTLAGLGRSGNTLKGRMRLVDLHQRTRKRVGVVATSRPVVVAAWGRCAASLGIEPVWHRHDDKSSEPSLVLEDFEAERRPNG